MVDAINISLSGLAASSARVRTAAHNIANAGTVGATDPAQGPAAYTPQDVVATAVPGGGVQTRVVDRDPAHVTAYDPNSPVADEKGQVAVPNVDFATELIDAKVAELAYRASAAVIKTADQMQESLLKTFDERA